MATGAQSWQLGAQSSGPPEMQVEQELENIHVCIHNQHQFPYRSCMNQRRRAQILEYVIIAMSGD